MRWAHDRKAPARGPGEATHVAGWRCVRTENEKWPNPNTLLPPILVAAAIDHAARQDTCRNVRKRGPENRVREARAACRLTERT